jgi:hypothetical protein
MINLVRSLTVYPSIFLRSVILDLPADGGDIEVKENKAKGLNSYRRNALSGRTEYGTGQSLVIIARPQYLWLCTAALRNR